MTVVFLNGCTSAGKSSIAKALQAKSQMPWLYLGIDDAFAMLPQHLHNHPDGFFFDRTEQNLVRLNFGAFGVVTLKAHVQSAGAIAESGVNLILDEVVLFREFREDWLQTLDSVEVLWVGVHCDLEELERREIARGDRIHGQARGQFDLVHQGFKYDLEIDTTHTPPEVSAETVILALDAN